MKWLGWYFKSNLLVRILIGLILGAVCGLAFGPAMAGVSPLGDIFIRALLDMGRTACNVTGDLAVTCIVAKTEKEIDLSLWGKAEKALRKTGAKSLRTRWAEPSS